MSDLMEIRAYDVIEACKAEREAEEERHSLRLSEIDRVEALAREMIDSAPQASPPQVPAEAESAEATEPPAHPSPPATKAPPVRPGGVPSSVETGVSEREQAEKMRKKLLNFVLEHPGCNQDEMAEHLGIEKPRLRGMIQNLSSKGKLRATGSTKNRRYFHGDAPLTTPPESQGDDDSDEKAEKAAAEAEGRPPTPPVSTMVNGRPGPKTELEREVVELLKERPQTIGGLGVKMKLTEKKLTPVLSGLVVRGVCRRKNVPSSAKPVFELVS